MVKAGCATDAIPCTVTALYVLLLLAVCMQPYALGRGSFT
jgi:hypothetical protein